MVYRLADLKIRPKLIILFLLSGILPLLIAGYYGSKLVTTALMEKSFNQLAAIQDIRTGQLESAFKQRAGDLKLLAGSDQLLEFSQKLIEYHFRETFSPDFDAWEYHDLVKKNGDALKRFVSSYGCADLKIIDAKRGHILFSNESTPLLNESLTQASYTESGLALAWEKIVATGKGVIIDFEPYEPAKGVETAFFGQPVKDRNGQLVAAIIIQVTPSMISDIMESRKGLGQTGESYLLNWEPSQNRFELRSSLQTMGDGKYVIGFSLGRNLAYWEDAVKKGDEGGHDIYVDSAGKAVLAAYNKLDIFGMNWFLISKIDQYEVEAPVRQILIKTLGISVILVALIGIGVFFLSRNISRPIIEDVKFAQAIAAGEFDKTLTLNQRDELGKLAWALNLMARTLHDQDWLKKGKEGLDDALRGEMNEKKLGQQFVSFMTRHLNAQLGALYRNHNGLLKLYASHAFTDRQDKFNAIKLGEGMVGQAALEQKIIIFNDVLEDAPLIHYGVGQKTASSYIIVPLIFEDEVVSILLLGSLTRFTDLQKQFIEQNIKNTAILMNTARSRRIIKQLLEDAQQNQQELLGKNQTLEQQTQALKASEAELQAQQEELRVTNEELEEQTRSLGKQKEAIEKKNVALVDARENIQAKAQELEIASKYKSEFLANMSHELRTPLNSILILSQLLAGNKKQNLTEKQIESSKAIHSSGEDLLTLINEILDLSKVEAGKIELAPENVLIPQIVDDLNRMFGDLAREKEIGFMIKTEPDMVDTIYTDPLRLQQILRNLLTNAFKFTKQGQVSLTIARPPKKLLSGKAIPQETAIAFAVKDEGIGIPKEQQAAVFEAFQQADGSTSRKYGGTGLGLSISRELAKLLGGFIHLSSKEAKGSTFTIVIPEHHSQDTGSRESASKEYQPRKSGPGDKNSLTRVRENSVSSSSEKQTIHPQVPGQDIQKISVRDDRKILSPGDKSLLIIEDDPNSARIENIISRPVRKLLVVEDDSIQCQSIKELIGNGDVETTMVATGLLAYEALTSQNYDCMILDLGLEDMSGFELLEKIRDHEACSKIPVIVYTGRDLTLEEDKQLRKYTDSIIIKGVKSPERLLEESALFLHRVEADLPREKQKILKVGHDKKAVLSEKTVLLVDDDMRNVFALSSVLEEKQMTVLIARDGMEGVKKANEHKEIDIVLMDIMMPRMDGYEAIQEIRKTKKKLPIIALTAKAMKGDRNKCIEAGANDYLAKPVDPDRLISMLRVWLYS